MTNLAARDKDMRRDILSSIAKAFVNVWTIAVPEDLNEIVVASPSASAPGLLSGTVADVVRQLAGSACKGSVAEGETIKEWTQFLSSAVRF